MKYLYSIITLLIVSVGFSQITIDFETGGYGANLTWTADQQDSSFAVVDNPVSGDSTNGSDKVGAVTMASSTPNWGLAYTNYDVTFTSSNATVSMDVYKPGRAVDVAIKFEIPGGASKQVIVTAGGGNAWETLSYDFSDQIDNGVTYTRIVIIPDFSSRTTSTVSYFDNITFSEGVATPDAAPTDAPTAPTESSSDVASLYSDAYTAAASVSWPNWGQPTVASETSIASNNVYKLSAFSFQGLDFSSIDINSYSSIKVDYWTDDATQIKVKLVDYGADGSWSPSNTESEVTHTVENTEAWNTIHINLSDFTLDAGKIGQVVLSSDSSDRLVYIDNIYFSSTTNSTATPTAPSDAPSTSYSYPDSNVLSIFSDYTAATYSVASWAEATASTESIANNEVLKLASCNFYAYENYDDLDFSGVARVEIDYWSENDTYNGGVTKIFVKLVDTDSSPVTELLIDLEPNGITAQSWQSVSINFADLDTSGIDLSSIDQIMLDNTNDGETLFIDNWIFSADQALSTTELPIEGLSLYPNPVVDRLNISAGSSIDQVLVFDLMGRLVKDATPRSNDFSLDVSHLNKGVYMVQLKAGDKVATTKLIK